MSYWSVRGTDDGLAIFVWADNATTAKRRVELWIGPFANGRAIVEEADRDNLDEYTDVLDEPELEKEARLDGREV